MPATPRTARTARHRIRAAALALPTLALTLTGLDLASAAPTVTPYVATNTTTGATVTTPTGSTHTNRFPLRAAAPDGTAQLLTAAVTPSRSALVAVDATSGVGRILAPTVATSSTQVYAGRGRLVLRNGSAFTLLNPTSGKTTALARVPAATAGTRQVTAVAATVDGALVATVDATEPGSSGQLAEARVWRLTATAATEVMAEAGAHVPALLASAQGIDAVLVSTTTDTLVHRRIAGGTASDTPVQVSLPADTIALDLGLGADASTPVLSLTTASGVSVLRLDGTRLRSAKAGSRLFVSATDVKDPRSVANPLSTAVTLTGIPQGPVAYGAKVTPKAAATASGVLPTSAIPASLAMTRLGKPAKVTAGRASALTARSCFTAAARATLFTTAAKPVTRCVAVKQKLTKTSYNQRTRVVGISTTAAKVRIDVTRRGAWVPVSTVRASKTGRVSFRAPAGKVRVVALADTARSVATLTVTTR